MFNVPAQHQTDPALAAGQVVNPIGHTAADYSEAYSNAAIARTRGLTVDEALVAQFGRGVLPWEPSIQVIEQFGLPPELMAAVERTVGLHLKSYPY